MLAAAMVVVLLTLTVGVAFVGSAVIARHRAQAVADLAALAAAGQVASGRETACGSASSLAAATRAAVASCTVDGLDVIVRVEVPVTLGWWGSHQAGAVARAGPVP